MLGLSVLSGSHLEIAREVLDELARHGAGRRIPVVVGGIMPDERRARRSGRSACAAVFTPKDFDLMAVMDRILDVIGAPRETRHAATA